MIFSVLLTACGTPQPPAKPDVVLVTLDTTRPDRLGAYGGPVPTPNLSALAQAGTRFDRAYSPTPLTLPAHTTLMSGLEPSAHGVQANGDRVVPPELNLMGEILASQGWTPIGSIAAFVTHPRWGLTQGFEMVDARLPLSSGNPWRRERAATDVVAGALDLLDQHPEPVLLWVHLYDAHAPYQDSYNAELERLDVAIGTLRGAMDGRERPTLWVIVGDHAEGLTESLEPEHGLLVDEAQMRVPWILSGPGVPVAQVTHPVGLADVLPTLLSLLGLAVPTGLDGVVQPGNPHPIVLESWQLTQRFGWQPHRALIDGSQKLSVLGEPQLFDVVLDPWQQNPLDRPERIAELLAILGEGVKPAPPTDLDPDLQAALAALGYLTPDSAIEASLELAAPNLQALTWLHQASAARLAGDREGEIKALSLVVYSHPEIREAWTSLIDAQEPFQATATAMQALKQFPEDPRLLTRAAALFGDQGFHDKALELATQAAALDPRDRLATELQVRALLGMRQREQALKLALTILQSDPEHAVVAGLAGLLLAQSGDPRAPGLLEQSARGMAPPLGVRTQLAAILVSQGHPEPAFELVKIELQVYPDSMGAQSLHAEITRSLTSGPE